MQTNNKMAVAPVGKLIWQMSIPPLISMFLQYSYNLIDSAFVARLSGNDCIPQKAQSYQGFFAMSARCDNKMATLFE